MSEVKRTSIEAEEFEQWVEEYRKGKPYWSTARIEICRDTWMERAKRDAAPELLELVEMVHLSFGGGNVITFSDSDIARFAKVFAKATGSQS